jgi:hypothetical protein
MAILHYNLGKAVTTGVQSLGAFIKLINADEAAKYIPPDTKFAVYIEGIEKNISESFVELATTSSLSINMSNEGVVGRFIGYLAASETRLRVIKLMDLNITDPNTTPVDLESLQPVTLLDEEITSISAESIETSTILNSKLKKYKLVTIYPIRGEKTYESKAVGTNNGANQLYNFLRLRGASIPKASLIKSLFPLTIIIGIIIAFLIAFAL